MINKHSARGPWRQGAPAGRCPRTSTSRGKTSASHEMPCLTRQRRRLTRQRRRLTRQRRRLALPALPTDNPRIAARGNPLINSPQWLRLRRHSPQFTLFSPPFGIVSLQVFEISPRMRSWRAITEPESPALSIESPPLSGESPPLEDRSPQPRIRIPAVTTILSGSTTGWGRLNRDRPLPARPRRDLNPRCSAPLRRRVPAAAAGIGTAINSKANSLRLMASPALASLQHGPAFRASL